MNSRPTVPVINLPVGDYTTYRLKATKDGYEIEYKSNDPTVLGVKKYVDKKTESLELAEGPLLLMTRNTQSMGQGTEEVARERSMPQR